MIEIKYLSKNEKGFSIDDIKKQDFNNIFSRQYLIYLNKIKNKNNNLNPQGKLVISKSNIKDGIYFHFSIFDSMNSKVKLNLKLNGIKFENQFYYNSKEFGKMKEDIKNQILNLGFSQDDGLNVKINIPKIKKNIKLELSPNDLNGLIKKSESLIIVDIQERFSNSIKLVPLIQDEINSGKYFEAIEILDITDGQEPFEFDGINFTIEKEYGFFGWYRDNVQEEKIIEMGKYLLGKGKQSTNDFSEDEIIEMSEKLDLDYGILEFENFQLGNQQIKNINTTLEKDKKYILVGGGKNECLFEIYCLMKIYDFDVEYGNEELIY